MRILGKVLMFVGCLAFLFGAGGMDSPSLYAPIVMVLAGIGLIYAGDKINEAFV